MRVRVCVHVRLYAFMYECMHVFTRRLFVGMYACMRCVCMYACMFVCMQHMHTCVYVRLRMCVYVRMRMCVFLHGRTYTHYVYTHSLSATTYPHTQPSPT